MDLQVILEKAFLTIMRQFYLLGKKLRKWRNIVKLWVNS